MAQGSDDGTPKVTPNIAEIQATLWDQVQNLRSGKTTPASANAVTNAIGKMFTGVKMQMEYYRQTGQTPEIALLALPPK